jgi:hypothetical protein
VLSRDPAQASPELGLHQDHDLAAMALGAAVLAYNPAGTML